MIYHAIAKTAITGTFKPNRTGDKAALKVITEHNIRIVIYEVNQKFKFVEYDKKNLVSIGTIGLIKAIITFNPSKQNRFTTYAVSYIDNKILIFLRKWKKDQKVSSLDQPIRYDENGESIKIKDTLFLLSISWKTMKKK